MQLPFTQAQHQFGQVEKENGEKIQLPTITL